MHYDALSSVDLITDGYGNIVERRSFDAWGKARKLLWQDTSDPATLLQLSLSTRGFTGHEHLDEVGLIHMNGRVYDADIGRFISPDPIVQAPFMTNSFNRYSYAMNNPLKYTDPTGYSWQSSNTGTCNTDGSMRDSKGNRNGSWSNNGRGGVSFRDRSGRSRNSQYFTNSNNSNSEIPEFKSISQVTKYDASASGVEAAEKLLADAIFATLSTPIDIAISGYQTVTALADGNYKVAGSILVSATYGIAEKKVKAPATFVKDGYNRYVTKYRGGASQRYD